MYRLRQAVTDARHRAKSVGARPQVRHFAQELHRVRFWLNRIGFRVANKAVHQNRIGLHFAALPAALAGDNQAGGFKRRTDGQA